ncbi:hypothetical protein ACC731_37645, partial [Rhizobium ruizarguesonis]
NAAAAAHQHRQTLSDLDHAVISALLADWPEENLRKAKEAGALIEPKEVADAIIFMLTRPRNVTISDIVVLPSAFDI